MWDEVGNLHAYHGDVPVEVRLLKLTEEAGEVADALWGVHGLNKRKGVCAVVMSGVTAGPGRARDHFERRLAAVTARVGL